MPEGGTSNLQALHHKYKHFCDSTQSVGGHIQSFCDHYSWPVYESGWHGNTTHTMHINKGNEHFRFKQPHLHIVGFIICTRAGVLKLAPSEVICTAFLYQGETFSS